MRLRLNLMILAAAAVAVPSASATPPAPAPHRLMFNQLGYLADGPKRAFSPDLGEAPVSWNIVDAGGKERLTGMSIPAGRDPTSGQFVQRIDFSELRQEGEYRLNIAGGTSARVRVGAPGYGRLAKDALAYFYHNRAGTPIEARLVGEQWARPAGHAREVAPCFKGADERGTEWPGCDYSLDVTGGWYDAGDHGKYVVNAGISVWTLLNLHERSGRAFPDGSLRIPENGNGVSDLLDEVRYEIEFLLKMQVPDGKRAAVAVGHKDPRQPPARLTEIDASGMAHHKVADAKWTGLPLAPHEDVEPRLLYPPSTGATLNLAAVAAQCARVWRAIDPAFAARCLTAAERAWAAATRNPQVYSIGAWIGSGAYGDDDFSDEFYWAAAELFISTGNDEYGAAVRGSPYFAAALEEPSWPRTSTLGTLSLISNAAALPREESAGLRKSVTAAADRFLRDAARNGYAIPYAPAQWPWGSTSSLLNRAMLLAHAAEISGEASYRDGVIDAMDWILGRNALGTSFVSGYGMQAMRNPHHRFWARQADPKYPPPPAGALSGGPSESFADPVAREMKGKCIGQTCWIDDYRAFSMNEVAINWNAPLAWVSAWMAEQEPGRAANR